MAGVLILGAGGHGKVVADILQCQGYTVAGFLDDESELWGKTCLGLPILGSIYSFRKFNPNGLVMGLGRNALRQRLVQNLGIDADPLWINAIHPKATIAASVTLGKGVVIAAGVVINPDTRIEDYVIVNTAASIDHDCRIGSYVHIAPGTRLAGTVSVGEGTLVGINATVLPNKQIGSWSVIGAGAVVVNHIADNVTVKGNPAR